MEGSEVPVVHRGCFVCGQALVSDGHIRDCVAKLKNQRRGFQLMAYRMIDIVSSGVLMSALEAGKYERASGEVECSECRLLYREHPQIPKMPTFHMLCLGNIVKT